MDSIHDFLCQIIQPWGTICWNRRDIAFLFLFILFLRHFTPPNIRGSLLFFVLFLRFFFRLLLALHTFFRLFFSGTSVLLSHHTLFNAFFMISLWFIMQLCYLFGRFIWLPPLTILWDLIRISFLFLCRLTLVVFFIRRIFLIFLLFLPWFLTLTCLLFAHGKVYEK